MQVLNETYGFSQVKSLIFMTS